MTKRRIIQQRTRIYIAGEGESEQSFIKFLQNIANQIGLHVHLYFYLLDGGGYKTMLEKSVRECTRWGKSKCAILLIDSDRSERDDLWSIEKLRKEASQYEIIVCIQNPNIEGVFFRLFPGNECLNPEASNVQKQLRSKWPNYRKPEDALSLSKKFSLDDLIRLAKVDLDLRVLLSKIGFFER